MKNLKRNIHLTLRKTEETEYPAVTDISVEVWKHAYKGIIDDVFLNSISSEARLKERIKWLTEPNKYSFIALYKDKIFGFCDFGISRHIEYGKGEIYAIYVLPEHHGKGAGTMLLKHAMHILEQKELTPYIVIALEKNITANSFYEKMGFHFIDTITANIGNTTYPENVYRRSDIQKHNAMK